MSPSFFLTLACENNRFSSLFAAGDVSRETFPAAKSEEKRMFSQAILTPSKPIFLFIKKPSMERQRIS